MTRLLPIAAAIFLGAVPSAPTAAHHGWAFATDEEFQLSGTIRSVRHGNPHGTMMLATRTGLWTVETGQPWRNDRAGVTRLLRAGTRVTVHGHRSARPGQRLVKAERLVIAGRSYNLYPDRPS